MHLNIIFLFLFNRGIIGGFNVSISNNFLDFLYTLHSSLLFLTLLCFIIGNELYFLVLIGELLGPYIVIVLLLLRTILAVRRCETFESLLLLIITTFLFFFYFRIFLIDTFFATGVSRIGLICNCL